MSRPDWHEYALGVAKAVSLRGDCTRRQVGAVIMDANHRIAGAGYNGSYPGGPSCLKGDCPRGRHYLDESKQQYDTDVPGWGGGVGVMDFCACGDSWPCIDAVPSGSSYDTGPGACVSSHAEQNALADVDNRSRLDGALMYVTCAPCEGCVRQVRNTTLIKAIIYPEGVVALP